MEEAVEQVVRAELVRIRTEARKSIRRGFVLMALIPVIAAGSMLAAFVLPPFYAFLAVLAAVAYMLIGGIAGFASIAGGVVDARRSGRELRAMDEVRKLPEARLLR